MTENPSDLVSFDGWLKSLGRTRTTGHRWRKKFPWLTVTNIFGKNYISRHVIAEFQSAGRRLENSPETVHPPNNGKHER